MVKISVNGASAKPSSTHSHTAAQKSSMTHSMLQTSTTYSRKYVSRPTPMSDIRPISSTRLGRATKKLTHKAPTASSVRPVSPRATNTARPVSSAALAKDAKDRAVKSALRSVATLEKTSNSAPAQPTKIKSKKKVRRVVFALFCSAATVGLLAFFINANMPDISVRVAAMQTGIEASYPTYIPRGYSLKSVTSEKNGQITMLFENENGDSFKLNEENSTWDSTALLNNYVKPRFNEYATLREQGITIYIHGVEAAWVNGGIFYHISSHGEALSKEQIRNLVTSL